MVATTPGAFATRRHAALFDDLVALFLDEGFADLSVAEIAARMRCSKSTLYLLADSKQELVRAGVTHFFRGATEQVERTVAETNGAAERITAYLLAVGDALAPASSTFMTDLHGYAPTRELYERNTAAAARRVGELIDEGVRAGEFRDVHAAFAGDLTATMMSRIQRREVAEATGLDDAQAYRQLASILTAGISRS